jgi:MscS family membrane protein
MRVPSWIPEPLRATGPAGIEAWQWIGFAATAIAALVVGRLAAAVARVVLAGLARRSAATWDDELLHRMDGPIRLLAGAALVRLVTPFLELPLAIEEVVLQILVLIVATGIVWYAAAVVGVISAQIAAAPWAAGRPAARALVLLAGRIAKVLVVVVGAIATLGVIGLPVASLIAGLGIGGIALAFGAQKTVENLFGAFAIGVDQPLREGDFVRLDDRVLGTVETVGLRSTRIRTLDRTVVSLPNGRVADAQIETFAARDRCRLHTTLGVVYGTTRSQLETLLAGLENVLRGHPRIWPDDVVVRFAGFGASSLDIEIMAWFQTADYGEFRTYRQEVLLAFMRVVEDCGTAFAFPTQTLHVESLPSPRSNGEPR